MHRVYLKLIIGLAATFAIVACGLVQAVAPKQSDVAVGATISAAAVGARSTGELYAAALDVATQVVADPATSGKVRSWLVLSEPVATALVEANLISHGAAPPPLILAAMSSGSAGVAQAQAASADGVTPNGFLTLFITYLPAASILDVRQQTVRAEAAAYLSGAAPFTATTELTGTMRKVDAAVTRFHASVNSLSR